MFKSGTTPSPSSCRDGKGRQRLRGGGGSAARRGARGSRSRRLIPHHCGRVVGVVRAGLLLWALAGTLRRHCQWAANAHACKTVNSAGVR